MEFDPTHTRYGAMAIALHWLTAALVVAGFTLGVSMVGMPFSREKLQWYAWHKWIGITIWLITWARIGWRLTHPAPAMVPVPEWQRRVAVASHFLLYALLAVIPVSGYFYSSAAGVQVVYLGIFPLPDLVAKDRALADVLRNLHLGLNFTLATLVSIHGAAALRHHFVSHDAVLMRMLPRSWTPRGPQ